MKNKILKLLRVLTLSFMTATCSVNVSAAVYDFGALLSGSFQPDATFAELSVTQTGANVYDFRLEAYDLRSLFGGNAAATSGGPALGRLAVDATPEVNKNNVSISDVAISWGTATSGSVKATDAGGPTGVWDFSFAFNDGGRLIESTEWVEWTASFNTDPAVVFNGFALHVQRIPTDVDPAGSAWYSAVTPIPEPEIYAMMGLGLGLMGFVARRRKQQAT